MAIDALPPIDYARVLDDLKSREKAVRIEYNRLGAELGGLKVTIEGLEKLVRPSPSTPVQPLSVNNAGTLSLYKAVIAVLTEIGEPLPNAELVAGLKNLGKELRTNDLAQLYNSVREKGDRSEVIRIGSGSDGKWALRKWGDGEQTLEDLLS